MQADTELEEPQEIETGSRLIPMQWPPEGYVPGRYAAWYCGANEDGQEEVYGPDELGEYQEVIQQLMDNVSRQDTAARNWEVLQAEEMRLFRRGYQFLTAGRKGWGMSAGQSVGSSPTGASIMQYGNTAKLFPCNVLGQRHKKITALLSREVPPMEITPLEEDDPIDQAAAEEGEKYLDAFIASKETKKAVKTAAGYFCTDGRTGFLTYTVADQTRFGTEMPARQEVVYGAPESDGISPETEMDEGGAGGMGSGATLGAGGSLGSGSEGSPSYAAGSSSQTEQPARREITLVGGKLEWKVPILADEESEMNWTRYSHEVSANTLKARYPWVKDKIVSQSNVSGTDTIDRLARINVRLAVQATGSGDSHKSDTTEAVTFLRPAEYESVEDEDIRNIFYQTFPDGMEIWHAGAQLAMVRNGSMSDHVKIVHPSPGDGQNREAILTNYLPLQKVLNANISLIDRYFRGGIARRFGREPYLDTQALNSTVNDPSKITPIFMPEGSPLGIADVTGAENVPSLNTSIMEFVQWLIQGGPEAMDGGSPAAFGEADNESDQGVFQTTRLKRDQALQVYSMPWDGLCEAVEAICQQSIESAARNRIADISASLPGQKRLRIEIGKLKGSVLVQRSSSEIPRTLAEEEEQMAGLFEQSANVALFKAITEDPENLQVFSQFPTLKKLNVPGANDVEQQQGEFEILMRSGPIANPQLEQIQEQIEQGQQEIAQLQQAAIADPQAAAALEEHQQAMQQLTQAAQQLPPKVSTVPVAQDTSENHAIHATITLGMLTSPTGRKLKYGDDQQKAIYQNLYLHWQEHMQVLQQLTPPPQVEMKASITVDPTKLPPEAQAKAFQALGLQVTPEQVTPQEMEHEVVTEREGVDENGIPIKQKVSVVGKPLN